jgi:hypothetical protein
MPGPDARAEQRLRLPGMLDGRDTVTRDKRSPRIIRVSWGRMEVEGLGARQCINIRLCLLTIGALDIRARTRVL